MVLIALIIAIHGVLGYVGFDQFWSYADVQEVTLSPVTEIILFAAIGPFALFMIALLFLVAGLLARPSLERKGPVLRRRPATPAWCAVHCVHVRPVAAAHVRPVPRARRSARIVLG